MTTTANKIVVLTMACLLSVGVVTLGSNASASSTAIATGDSTVDGRPVAWKNRDHWSTADGWKTSPLYYTADGSSFGSGDRYTSRFNYVGITAFGTSGQDPITGITVPWAGANDRGLGLVQGAGHTLTSDFTAEHGFHVSQDLENGMTGGYLNHVILSRAEHVDEVEQILRDTDQGGGFNNSFARNTSTLISVFDRWGNAATFEMDGDSFSRDNVTEEIQLGPVVHDNDANYPNPPDGTYSGYDWRTNFSRVSMWKWGFFPYLHDYQETIVNANGDVENIGSAPDGVHDWEYSPSAVKRHTRVGIRMDDVHKKNYRYFIQKYVGTGALAENHDVETLAKNIGTLPGPNPEKPVGFHLNRFVSTFGAVLNGTKIGDPYDGKLTTVWMALGEPTVSIFVPVFPFAGTPPPQLVLMHQFSNIKRHQVYDYTNDDSCGYSCGRNVDHSIDINALTGGRYYGEGGIQKYTFGIENWAFNRYDEFMADLRTGWRSEAQLKSDLAAWQGIMVRRMTDYYAAEQSPMHTIDNIDATGTPGWANSVTQPGFYSLNYEFVSTSGGTESKRWTPHIDIAGNYKVSYWLPDGTPSRPTNAPYTVVHSGGSETILVNQQATGGRWIELGTFKFDVGTSGYVELTNKANGLTVIADAIQFELQLP